MNYYETLYIVHPALEAGRLKDIILSLEEKLKNLGGKVLSIDLWGKKRLAYLIDKQKYGTYVKLQFTGIGNCTGSFETELEHNPNILSYLSTLIEETDVVEQENDLDTQIAGHSRETHKIDKQSQDESTQNSVKDDNSADNDIAPSSETDVTIGEKDDAEKADTSEKDEVEKADTSEKNTANQENANETVAVSEEE
tara:strand:- start:180 stop:767 length:588 start_codon:yes stop_codon:yes gene_type:complete